MPNPETTKNQNESYEPDEVLKSLANAPSFDEHMRKVRAKREFQEKYGDHPDSKVAENANEYLPPEGFVKNPDLKPRTGQEQDHPVQIERTEEPKNDNPFGPAPEPGPNEFI